MCGVNAIILLLLMESQPPQSWIVNIDSTARSLWWKSNNGQWESRFKRQQLVIFVFLLKSRLIRQISVRSCVGGIATVDSLLQTAGVCVYYTVNCMYCYTVKNVFRLSLRLWPVKNRWSFSVCPAVVSFYWFSPEATFTVCRLTSTCSSVTPAYNTDLFSLT